MAHPRLRSAVLGSAALLLLACGSGASGGGAAGGGATETVAGRDGSDASSGGDIAQADAPLDPGGAREDRGPDLGDPGEDADSGPVLLVGTNEQGKNQPEFFVPLQEGGEIEVVKGSQNLWMVVVALKTRNLLEGPFDVHARLLDDAGKLGDEGLLGEITLIGRQLVPGGDGFDYFYNLFLVAMVDASRHGIVDRRAATLEVSVGDKKDHEASETFHLVMVGGP